MLEQFLERNIFRRVYICEQLFDYQKINIKDMGEVLGVCSITIDNDIKDLINKLDEHIEQFSRKRNLYTVIFKECISVEHLIHSLYSDSCFLQTLGYFLKGTCSIMELTELEYISISKAYESKNNVINFFKQYGYIKNQEIKIPELDYRYMILMLVEYTGYDIDFKSSIQQRKDCETLIKYVEDRFFNRNYSNEDSDSIIKGIEIAFSRYEFNPVELTEEDKIRTKNLPLYKIIEKGINILPTFYCLSENEYMYIFTLFNSKKYTSSNMDLLLKDFDVVYSEVVLKHRDTMRLLNILENKLGNTITNNLLFKKVFLQFSRTLIGNIQAFITGQIYLLKYEQKEFYDEIEQCIEIWQKKNKSIHINYNFIRKLSIVIEVITNERELVRAKEVLIVADTDTKYLYYRNLVDTMFNGSIKVSNIIYKRLNEIEDDCIYNRERIVLCDYKVYRNGKETKSTTIIPVSINTAELIVKNIY